MADLEVFRSRKRLSKQYRSLIRRFVACTTVTSFSYEATGFTASELKDVEEDLIAFYRVGNTCDRVVTITELAFLIRCIGKLVVDGRQPKRPPPDAMLRITACVKAALIQWRHNGDEWQKLLRDQGATEGLDALICRTISEIIPSVLVSIKTLASDESDPFNELRRDKGAEQDKADRSLVTKDADAERTSLPYHPESKFEERKNTMQDFEPPAFFWATYLQEATRLFIFSRTHSDFVRRCKPAELPENWKMRENILQFFQQCAQAKPVDETVGIARAVYVRLRLPLGAKWSAARLQSSGVEHVKDVEALHFDCGDRYGGSLLADFQSSPKETFTDIVLGSPETKLNSSTEAWLITLFEQILKGVFGIPFFTQYFIAQEEIYEKRDVVWSLKVQGHTRMAFIVNCNGRYYVQFPGKQHMYAYDCGRDLLTAFSAWLHVVVERYDGVIEHKNVKGYLAGILDGKVEARLPLSA